MPKQTLDVIVTSCGRFDLLRRMLDSFFEYADKEYEYNVMIYDDYGYAMAKETSEEFKGVCSNHPNIKWFYGRFRIGQIAAIDYLMTDVKTDYYIHLEDDWEFLKTGWVKKSIEFIGNPLNESYIQLWLRGKDDLNGHPIAYTSDGLIDGIKLSRLSTNYHWKGFSFNPAVRRLSDYQLIGKYGNVATFNPKDPSSAERKIGEWYCKKGYVAGVFHEQYVKHLGNGRTIKPI